MGDSIIVEINELGARGDGIAKTERGVVFVPFAAPGDVLEVALEPTGREAFRGQIIKIITEGPTRETPPCEHFTKCGGCQLQQLKDSVYRDWIRKRPLMALAHQGLHAPEVLTPHFSNVMARRRVELKALRQGSDLLLGYHAASSHTIIDMHSCIIMAETLFTLVAPLRGLLKSLLNKGQGASVQMTELSMGVDLILGLPDEITLEARERLAGFAHDRDLARLSVKVGGFLETIADLKRPMVCFSGVDVSFPPGAFLQATHAGEQALVVEVKKAADGCARALDLFSGLGTFTFALAEKRPVHAVEGDMKYCHALEAATIKAVHMKPVTVEHRDIFRRPLRPDELQKFDLVVFDPPRAGAREQCRELAKSDVPRVIAVSCNANSFARDARILMDGGYRLQWLRPVDQFLWSYHLELVALFEKDPVQSRGN